MESLQFLSVMLSVLSVVAAALMMLAMTLDGHNPGWRPGDSVNEFTAGAVAVLQGKNPVRET